MATNTRLQTASAVKRERLMMRLAIGFAMVSGFVGILLMYGPVAWLALMSVSERPLTGAPGPFTSIWYGKLLADTRWVDPMLTSLGIASIVSLLCMVAATAIGRILPHAGRTGIVLMAAFLVVLFVPGVMLGVDFIIFYRLLIGLRTGLWSLILAHFVWAFPFALLSVMVVSSRFDRRLLEIAADLGAGPWRRFRDIEAPLLMPGIISAGFFGFLLSLNELPRSIFLRGGWTTLPLFQWAESASHSTMVPLIYSLSTLINVASLLLTIFALRLLLKTPDA